MALCTRSVSPIFDGTGSRQKDLIVKDDKIHRIALGTRAVCVLAHVVSTNCVWFKLANHISERLRAEGDELMELDPTVPLERYQYVMAPLDGNVYARGRVLYWSEHNEEIVFVHFIDEGHGAWMYKDCLASMDPSFRAHPWQAFPIALFKLFGTIEPPREELSQLLNAYSAFILVPAHGNQRNTSNNNYLEHMRAEVYGLLSENESINTDEKKSSSESIAHKLALFGAGGTDCLFRRALFEARQVPLVVQHMQRITRHELSAIPKWRKSFPCKDNLMDSEQLKEQIKRKKLEDENWEAADRNADASISIESVDWLRKNCYSEEGPESGMIQICIDWNSLKSPHEFYAFALCRTTENGPEGNKKGAIRSLYERQMELSDQLDSFYGKIENQRQFCPEEIAKRLKTREVFAIHESSKNMYNGNEGGTFRRVQIISIRNMNAADLDTEFCRIRYCDVGGSEIVPLSGLLQMHPKHREMSALCMQLTLESINPPDSGSGWLPNECAFFRSLIRTDRPMKCFIRPPLSKSANYQPTTYNASAHRWTGVFGVSRLMNGDISVEQQMIKGLNGERMASKSNLDNGW